MEIIHTDKAPAAVGPYSQAIKANGMLYASGQVGFDPATGLLVGDTIEAQAEQVMKNIGAVLEAAGLTYDDVVKTTCFITDMKEFATFNGIYGKYFVNNKPARSCVEVSALPKGAVCEVEIVAVCR
ncbi:MAG: RidA family protein [Lachnospiraceae bacterium]|nr:RidA family protein [Lachnospiraceae bacterium]